MRDPTYPTIHPNFPLAIHRSRITHQLKKRNYIVLTSISHAISKKKNVHIWHYLQNVSFKFYGNKFFFCEYNLRKKINIKIHNNYSEKSRFYCRLVNYEWILLLLWVWDELRWQLSGIWRTLPIVC
jgi:hypothetical protein